MNQDKTGGEDLKAAEKQKTFWPGQERALEQAEGCAQSFQLLAALKQQQQRSSRSLIGNLNA